MGKGDIKTKRGKIANNTYGTRRKRKSKRKRLAAEKATKGAKK